MKKWCLLVVLAVGFLGACVSAPRVSASQFDSYDECINASGGRGDISSVDWACGWVGYATETVCALWIGSTTSTVDPIIYTDKASGDLTIRYYRMCYDGTLGTARIWVENDNGAIDDSKNMNGGSWSHPKHIDTKLNIGKFISGISSTEVTHDGKLYDEYSRVVTVGRQSETASSCDAYSGACSEMEEKVRVRVLKKSFQAKADVSDASTEYVVNGSTSKNIECNDTGDGCSVNFSFHLKRTVGTDSDSTTYSIEKIGPSGSWTAVDTNVSSTPSSSGTNVKTYNNVKIKAGQRICYRMTYHPFGSYGTSAERIVSACAYAVGEFSSSIDVKAKKTADASYSNNVIYARPDGKVYLQGTYSPEAQFVANLRPSVVEVNKITNDSSGDVKSRFNNIVGSNGWKNVFSVRLDRDSTVLKVQHKSGTVGSTTKYQQFVDYSIDARNDVGKKLIAKALTNNDNDRKTVPKKSTVSHDGSTGFKVVVDPGGISDELQVIVPYNFINSTEVTLDKALYAGEDMPVPYSINTQPGYNEHTGRYATIVRKAKWELQMSADGGNTWEKFGEQTNQTLNSDGKIDGATMDISSTVVTVPDAKAGSEVCFRSAVYPATSDDGKDNLDPNGDGRWAYSATKCYPVAKRPSLQVWGGNIYSNGAITTSVAVKKRLAGESDGTHVFGSWGELGIIANGQVKGLASGAGYAYNTGANNTGFCFVSTLSFANDKCNSETTGSLGVSFGVLDDEKKLIIEKLTNAEDVTKYSSTDELEERIGGDSGIILVENDETVNITKPIIYDDTYTSFESMPKVVIYAKNVNINCNVTQIDALIIAEDAVNTCSNISDVNDQGRSVQLKVNGAIVADRLIAGRTYGAGTGTNSGIPAEIINFDPSLYLWGNDAIKTDPNSSLVNVYLRELSPRY